MTNDLQRAIDSVISYVPRRIIEMAMPNATFLPAPVERLHGSIVFVDVVGFTTLSSALAREGNRGNEAVMQIMTEYYSVLIEQVHRYGGTVYQFAGDSVLVSFTREKDESDRHNALRAAICLLEIQKKLKRFSHVEILGQHYSITSRSGCAFGEYYQILLGDPSLYLRPVITGDTVERAVEAQLLSSGGEVVASPLIMELIQDRASYHPRDRMYLLENLRENTQDYRRQDGYHLPTDLYSESFLTHIARYLDPVLYGKITSGHAGFLCEHREVTSLLIRLDMQQSGPGDISSIESFNDYYNEVLKESRNFGGMTIQVDLTDKGNVIFVLFGAPVALENKEELAVRMSLRLLQIASDPVRFHLISRIGIGITTGSAYCGDLGAPTRKGYTVLGEDVNTATRLMSLDLKRHIHIDERTANRVEQRFQLERRDGIPLKGISESATVFRVLQEKLEIKPEDTTVHSPFIGREKELQRLLDCYRLMQSGDGQIVAVTGEAGLGKSKLAEQLSESTVDSDREILINQCYPYERYTPFFAWKQALRILFGIEDLKDPKKRMEVLRSEFQQLKDIRREWLPVIARIAGLPLEESHFTKNLDPEMKNRRIFQIVFQLIARKSLKTPIVLVFDDAHWIDEISLDLIKHIARKAVNFPVMILLLLRKSGILSNISLLRNFTLIELDIVDNDEMRLYLHNRFRLHIDNPEFEARLIDWAAGNPFFLESLVQSLIDNSVLVPNGDERYKLRRDLQNFEIPRSINEVILARIDGLNESQKVILKTAAVIGYSFQRTLLEFVLPASLRNSVLDEGLSHLMEVNLIRREEEGQGVYIFKHILIRDTAYGALLHATREELHHRLASRLESMSENGGADIAGKLAYHYHLANDEEKSLQFSIMAGTQAKMEHDNKDALFHFQNALEILNDANFSGNRSGLYIVLNNLAEMHRRTGDFAKAHDEYQKCLAIAPDGIHKARIHIGLGQVLHEMGRIQPATRELEKGLRLLDKRIPSSRLGMYLHGAIALGQWMALSVIANRCPTLSEKERESCLLQAAIYTMLSRIYFYHDPRKVVLVAVENLILSHRLGTPVERSQAEGNFSVVLTGIGMKNKARQFLEKGLEFARNSGDPITEAVLLNRYGYFDLANNEPGLSIEKVNQEIGILKEIGERWELVTGLYLLGQAHFFSSQLQQAVQVFQELYDTAEEMGSRWHMSRAIYWNAFCLHLQGKKSATAALDLIRIARLMGSHIKDPRREVDGFSLLLHIRNHDAEAAGSGAISMYKILSGQYMLIPTLQYVYLCTADAALYALEGRATGVPRRRLMKTAERSIRHSLKLGKKKIPYLYGPAMRLSGRLFMLSGKKAKARAAILDSIRILEKTENRWDLALACIDAAGILTERREEFIGKARGLLGESGLLGEMRRLDSFTEI